MRLFTLVIIIVILFILGLLFVRKRNVMKGSLSAYLIPVLLLSGLFFVVIGKITIFFAILVIGFILLASSLRLK